MCNCDFLVRLANSICTWDTVIKLGIFLFIFATPLILRFIVKSYYKKKYPERFRFK